MQFSDLFSSANIGTTAGGLGAGIGLAASAFGAYKSYEGAQAENAAQTQIIGLEQQAEGQREQAMELTAQRSQMEVLRNNQRARAMALQNATTQGGQYGTSLQAGYGQISGESNTQALGINQNLMIGRNLFSIDSQISQQKIALANAKTQEATGQGISSFGSSLGKSIDPLIRLASLASGLVLA